MRPERVRAVLDFVESIVDMDEAVLIGHLVQERHATLERAAIAARLQRGDLTLGGHVTWMHEGRQHTGVIKSISNKFLTVVEDGPSTSGTWHVNPLIAEPLS